MAVKKRESKAGLTLVEVMVGLFLIGVAGTILYTEMMISYRILMRSRARLEAQGMAFDRVWEIYNTPLDEMPNISTNWSEETPEDSVLSANGTIDYFILAETNTPVLPDPVWYWDIVVQVWAPSNSPLDMGDKALARYALRRYRGDR